jgi:hypothetical protein
VESVGVGVAVGEWRALGTGEYGAVDAVCDAVPVAVVLTGGSGVALVGAGLGEVDMGTSVEVDSIDVMLVTGCGFPAIVG